METLYVLIAFKKKLPLLILSLFLAAGVSAQVSYTGFSTSEGPPSATDPSANVTDAPVELGVKFMVNVPGVVNGIRFYKGNTNTGTHIGSLWTNGNSGTPGTNLASATFIGESAGGWQEVTFGSPVHINASTVYVASYYSPVGVYASEANYFNSGDDTRGPIVFIDVTNDPAGAGNGVYGYGGTSNFPTGSFQASNYWVDIRFTPDFPLPVSLTDFNASAGSNNITLNWKTASESNNKGFEIQRSNNNRDWYAINFTNGAGQSSTTRTYSFVDKGLAPGVYYYRLNQIDFDGKSKASSVVTATISGRGSVALFQNVPNPFHGSSNIRFDLPSAQQVRLSLFDLSGREVKLLVDGKQESGTHQVTINASGLGRQLYYVRLQTETGILTKNIIVQ